MRKILALLVAAAIVAPAALAGGGPSPGVARGGAGVLAPSGELRYVALAAGTSTVVAAVGVRDGRVLRSRAVPGSFGIPLVTGNGTAGGLAADGRTLVLEATGAGFRKLTRLPVLDTARLRVTRTVTLRGTFSFDALSPDARTLYLTEYLSPENVSYYRVRAYDLAAGRLLQQPIVDRTEPDERMAGQAIARVTGPGGRWVYTLYGGGPEPFVHALDTVGRKARCLDVEWEGSNTALWKLRLALSPDGRQILLVRPDGSRAVTVAAPKA